MSVEAPTPVEESQATPQSTAAVLDLIAPERKATTDSESAKKPKKVVAHALPTRFRDRFPNGVNWWNVGWMLTMSVGAVAAFWHFSWAGLATCVILHWVTACLGVTLGFHRLLTHGSLVVSAPVKYFFTVCGMLSAEGSPLYWVATHRKHHVLSDLEGDPHSPNDGFWWSHMLWFKPHIPRADEDALLARWAPDLWKDPVQRIFHRIFPLFAIMLGVGLFLLGEWLPGTTGWSMLLWGLCLRMVLCYHSTWFVNSATHIWGYRNYETTDRSRNLWWVALISYGEGWHNNHHAHQRLARHGHKWWEIDVTYMVIRTLKAVGLAKDVQDKLPTQTAA